MFTQHGFFIIFLYFIFLQVETSFHNVDPSHQLKLEIHINGFKTAILDFPRTEIFCKKAKFGGTKFSLSEVVPFDRDSTNGISCIVLSSKIMIYLVKLLMILVSLFQVQCMSQWKR